MNECADADEPQPGSSFPEAFFGTAETPPAEWDTDDSPDDDEELAENPPGLVAMLGFDPRVA